MEHRANTPECLIETAIERIKNTRKAALEDMERAQARIAACDKDQAVYEAALAKLSPKWSGEHD